MLKVLLSTSIALSFGPQVSSLFADELESGQLGLESQSYSEGFSSFSEEFIIATFVILVIALLLWSLWSQWDVNSTRGSVKLYNLLTGPSAKNLFFGVQFRLAGDPGKDHAGYLRSIDTRGFSMVSDEGLRKGQHIDIILSSLPGFPSKKCIARARVLNVQKLNENAHSVKLKFDDEDSVIQQVSRDVQKFIVGLSKPRSAFHNESNS